MGVTEIDIYNNTVIIQTISLFNEHKKIVDGIIITDDNEAYVTDLIGDNKDQRAEIEKEYEKELGPVNKERTTIIKTYRSILNPMEEVDKELREKMGIFLHERKVKEEKIATDARMKEQEKLQNKKEDLQEKLEKTGDADIADTIKVVDAKLDNVQNATIKPVKSSVGRISKTNVSYKWTYEIEEVEKLPREYLMPNTAKIEKIIQGEYGTHTIPGCRIYQKPIVNTKRK